MKRYLLDTDILIDALRGYPDAIKFIEANKNEELGISVITLSELHAGVRSKKEEQILRGFLEAFVRFPVDDNIACSAGALRATFGRAYGAGLVDCIIAATALNFSSTVITLNKKHYPEDVEVMVPYKK